MPRPPLPIRPTSVAALLTAALLSSCAPLTWRPGASPALNLNAAPPDVVLLSVSGRCGPPCAAPRDDWDSLTPRGTVDAVANALAATGLSVQVAGYASNANETFFSRQVLAFQPGFGALVRDLDRMKTSWLAGPNPPRLVLLGHSQGVIWTHYLTRINPDVRFSLLIDLDGSCTFWTADRATDRPPVPLNYPAPGLPKPAQACDNLATSAGTLRGKDVVWPNVERNLEVQSKRLPARTSPAGGLPINYLFDLTRNARPDGSRTGIETFVSVREDHSAISSPRSDAVRWISEHATQLTVGWKLQRPDQIQTDQIQTGDAAPGTP
ncbi:hypothetical protein E7T06_01995 [Deinococcus sp. Arct2-2]|uniref:hypothetical protein n=1 Tax=Deinococcus sp. Arct2-2 TaxID=2568653 RepID=UPI0010A48E7D|nr:hypothetical protein [Deinococcus sp. Arct2-2]THF71750.1 hypothetical protein E7T06_01995 [Deinococcus sp. Arct2-2]